MRARFDTSRLKPGVWFVRSNKGQGLFPVTREGQRVLLAFVGGMLGSAVVGAALALISGSLWWLAIMVLGMVASAAWFILTARRHGDPTVNVLDLIVKES